MKYIRMTTREILAFPGRNASERLLMREGETNGYKHVVWVLSVAKMLGNSRTLIQRGLDVVRHLEVLSVDHLTKC